MSSNTRAQAVARTRVIGAELTRLSELPHPTADDEQRFDALTAEFDQISAELQPERDRIADSVRRGHVESSTSDYAAGDGYDRDTLRDPNDVPKFRGKDPWAAGQVATFGRTRGQVASEYRSRALSAVELMPSANARIRAAATDMVEEHDDEQGRLSQFVLALSDPTYLRSFAKLVRDPHGTTLEDEERRAVARVKEFARAMSLTDTAGGYMVPFQLDPTLILTSAGSRNDIRQAARRVVATGDVWHGISAGAVSWSYAAEGAEAGDNAPTLAQPEVPVHKAHGFVPISYEAFEDAANVTGEVGRLLAFGKDTLEATAFATGSGTGQPTGIVTALVAAGASVVVASAGADALAIGDVYAVHDALPARHRAGASWLANNATYTKVRQFDTSGGGGFWANLGDGRPDGLLNRPVLEAEAMDGAITTGAENYALIIGDFAQGYVIADRIGTTVELIPNLFGATRRPTGQRGWYAHVRHGAAAVDTNAFRLLNVT